MAPLAPIAAAYISHTKYNNTFILHINMNISDEGLLDSYGNDAIVSNTLKTSPVTFHSEEECQEADISNIK